MQVKVSPVSSRDEEAARMLTAVYKPARLNFAQVCLCCGARWCEAPACIALHDRSLWGPCVDCDGFGTLVSCRNCCNGVVEVTVEGAAQLAMRVLPAHVDAVDWFVRADVSAVVMVLPSSLGRAV